MRNIKLIIKYDGTNYCGWQRQNIYKTLQGELEIAISKLTNEPINLIGSSRTDAGVHARGMVANFLTESTIPSDKFKNAINCKLPDDIAVINSTEVPLDFHSRYQCKGKTYSYTILNCEEPVIFERNFVYQYKYDLNVEEMKKACTYFLGKHDFIAFRTLGSSTKTTIRTITDIHIVQHNDTIRLFVTADGFLYNMVRIIVGTLLKVGRGKIKAEDVESIIEDGIRDRAGQCAPARGLILEQVYY